ncbi:MAG: TonB-dependent receptor [Cyclobacteriaceae bacterium]|nr:TonB-dependent receptor [Cyclobacteriaceae bacterium]
MKKILVLLFLSGSVSLSAQSILDSKLSGGEKGKTLISIMEELERANPVRFYFLSAWLDGIILDQDYEGQPLRVVFDNLFLGTDLSYLEIDNHAIVIVRDPTMAIQRLATIQTAKREQKKIEKLSFGSPEGGSRNKKVTLRGHFKDSKNNEPLVGASIYASDIQSGVTTDAEGNFSLTLPAGEHVINLNYVNYEERIIDLSIYQDGELNMSLDESPRLLEEIVVMDKAAKEVTTSKIGQTQFSMKEIKRQPALLGEVDLIKQIQVQPGVTTAGEAASGFNVRGGGVDQNLILYDGMPVFNSSHVFGFFSTFNAEAIRDVTFYRGGIPAEFGGRVSSVLDITSREGNFEKWSGSGGIGIISSNLLLNGPIKKDKTSLSVSLRSTYSDWLINTVRSNYVDLQNSSVSFYDGSAKLTHKFNDRTKITFSGYTSHDQFRLQGDSTYKWNNYLGSIRLDHAFSSKFSSTVTLGSGAYNYNVADKNEKTGFNLSYQITYPSVKADFQYQTGIHKISFGLQSTYYLFDPGTLEPNSSNSNIMTLQMDKQKSIESGVYLGDGITFNEKYFFEGGVRFSVFNAFGPASVNLYAPGVSKTPASQTGVKEYGAGEMIQTYTGAEPRASFRYTVNPNASIKVGYNRIYQYLHLVTNTTAITPVDIWQPSNFYFKPQVADQVSIGYFRNFKEKMYEAFVEVYQKKINNILDFKDGAELILNDHLETDLLQGVGEAYGVETSIAKNLGRLTGSINYTYSRSLRTINGEFEDEKINKGNQYPSNFDQPHIVNLVWKYNLSRRYFFTGNFTYHTGRPVTVPLAGFLVDNITVANFSERNQFRIPDYHRLDIAFILEGNHKRKKFWDGTWALSFYNVYARKNPYTVFFKDNGDGYLSPYQLSIVGTILPSLSYSFKF